MIIDLRSDTVTKPSAPMLQAILTAPVGDDVFNEDPTIIQLEEKLAAMFNMQAGLFCPSGTMTNQIAIKAHTQPGDEVICDVNSHIYVNEGGGVAFNSGVQVRLLNGDRGRITAPQVEENINGDFDWLPRTALVSLENTINKAGGSFYTVKEIEPIAQLCKQKNLPLHLDGARIFNALQASKETPPQHGSLFNSISVCLSKGLGAPVGSVLLGDKIFIKKARRIRKVFGGGMRQGGILAAAGLYAIAHNITRLNEDHTRAKQLEKMLQTLPFIENILPVDTNIVIFNVAPKISSQAFVQALQQHNIKAVAFGKNTMRMVTHLDFTDDMLNEVAKVLKKIAL
ncbi:MAG: threonine aldolase family protein [Bacteroidia bacterium]